MTKILTTFFSVLLVDALPLSSADDRARIKEEVRQELLSIQTALDEMKGGSSEITFPPKREPEPVPPSKSAKPPTDNARVDEVKRELQAVQSGLDQLNRASERFSTDLGTFPPAPQPKIIPPAPPEIKEVEPEKAPSKVDEVERELQAIQAGLDEMNRASQRPSRAMKPAPSPTPTPPVISDPAPVR